MIYIDPPRPYPRYGLCSHLMSDLPGEEGHAELMAFAKRLGHKPQWLQHAGTYREHFDVMRSRIEVAKRLGAVEVPTQRIVEMMHAKRQVPA